MVYFVKEVFKVYINYVLITFINILLRLLYRLLGIAVGAKPVTTGSELYLKQWHNYLMHRLL